MIAGNVNSPGVKKSSIIWHIQWGGVGLWDRNAQEAPVILRKYTSKLEWHHLQ